MSSVATPSFAGCVSAAIASLRFATCVSEDSTSGSIAACGGDVAGKGCGGEGGGGDGGSTGDSDGGGGDGGGGEGGGDEGGGGGMYDPAGKDWAHEAACSVSQPVSRAFAPEKRKLEACHVAEGSVP